MKNKEYNRTYWEKNIEGFAGFYDKQSEEKLPGSLSLSCFYKKIIFPIEKRYMYHRHVNVCNFIEKNIRYGMKVADIGCGSGVYVKKMIQNGAFVYAFDYVNSAIELTKRNLSSEEITKSEIKNLDIVRESIPNVDIAISIGVLPYIDDLNLYLNNILPNTSHFYFNYLDKNNIINLLRKTALNFLDVRKYSYHAFKEINTTLEKYHFSVIGKTKLATGFILEAKRK